ncbi:peroxiredoxin-5, mitochondrial-like [Mizuhopecten yessoensis]|uniref:Peroxiredoxin-5 n=1 Tax=Mizuhopecten yessoensis TaxID=6573 RepID=A0A210QNW2_MIZYE|nr:peroxiredoxin-5, mitochondrial-like [Mizuhopecten yessoensis]OWF50395.1 Peroxiredoxin-5, mitochondrial [Mizuhopecten yessoensis]
MSLAARCVLNKGNLLKRHLLVGFVTGQKRTLKIGNELPSVNLYEESPKDTVNILDLFKGKRGVLFSVVGAFTPGCTEVHLPDYLDHYEKFKNEGYDLICCVAVNDPFVMSAWGKQVKAEGKIRMLADTQAEFTRAISMELDCRKIMGNIRSKRYSMVVENGVIQSINTEPDNSGLSCLLCIKNYRSNFKPG